MAIDYQLKLAAPVSADDAVAVLRPLGLPGHELHRDGALRSLSIPGLLVIAGPPTPSPFKLVLDAFGFDPRLGVTFVWDREADYPTMAGSLVRAAGALLRALPGDAVLLSNHEQPLLLRRGGAIELTTWEGWWTNPHIQPALTAQLGLPHRFRFMPLAW